MTKLEELIYSLATALVRYHDSQPKVSKLVNTSEPTLLRKKAREYAIGIIQSKEIMFDQRLNALIENCTKGYLDRKEFLTYLLDEIIFLKKQLERKKPFNSEELIEYQKQVVQLFIDFKQLLNTSKDKKYKVIYSSLNYENKTYNDLSGLINNAWVGNIYCNSGTILIEEVLHRFHLSTTDSNEEIKEIAFSLCIEHQNALLISEHRDYKNELENQLSELVMQKFDLIDTNKQQEKTISELSNDLDKTRKELFETKLKLQEGIDKKTQKEEPQTEPKGINSFYPRYNFGFHTHQLFTPIKTPDKKENNIYILPNNY
ncbi:MAG: hypothetical protein HYX60_05550 [Legionella longbeachae]|nr:hypothetical protein [Legionella longbeachae]